MLKFFCINCSLGSTASFVLIKHFWLDPHNAEQTLCQSRKRGGDDFKIKRISNNDYVFMDFVKVGNSGEHCA